MIRFILNIQDGSADGLLAYRAACYLECHPEKEDALMEYENGARFYVKRNKASISVWEQ